ncbi:glyoxalase [Pararobbsia silviterrae]|nr:glyoxalase [Pararobbsia silviterrae]
MGSFAGTAGATSSSERDLAPSIGVAVGPQYDTTHVYVAEADLDAFVNSFTATFDGRASPRGVFQVTPTPSQTASQYIQTPVGMLSVFGFKTPVPYPFGAERTGYLVTDIDEAVKQARAAGADVIVAPFDDPIGRDAIVQFPGGVDMQLYWHTKAPHYGPLETVPVNRVYLSPYKADAFVRSFVRFSKGHVVRDDRHADAAQIGLPGQTFRRIDVVSAFGKLTAFVTDGRLPYPYGRELTGYAVKDLDATLDKAKASGASIVSDPVKTPDGRTAMIQFPGGYVAEIHEARPE